MYMFVISAVPCPVPTTINRGDILNTGDVAVGDILRVTCPAIYQLSTDKTITCISGDVYDPDISTVNCVGENNQGDVRGRGNVWEVMCRGGAT